MAKVVGSASRGRYVIQNSFSGDFYEFWWKEYVLDMYCAKRDGDRETYDARKAALDEMAKRMKYNHAPLLNRLPQPVEWD